MTGRLLASLLAGALAVAGAADPGWGEPRPADRIIPVDAPPLAAGAALPQGALPTAGALRAVAVERDAPPADPVHSPAASAGGPLSSSAAAASIEHAADPLKPVGGLPGIRSKP